MLAPGSQETPRFDRAGKLIALLELTAFWAVPIVVLTSFDEPVDLVVGVAAFAIAALLYALTALALEGRLRRTQVMRVPYPAMRRAGLPVVLAFGGLLLLFFATDLRLAAALSAIFYLGPVVRILVARDPSEPDAPSGPVPRRARIVGAAMVLVVTAVASVTPFPTVSRQPFVIDGVLGSIPMEQPVLLGNLIHGNLVAIDQAQLAPDGSSIIARITHGSCQSIWSAEAVETSPGTFELDVRLGARLCLPWQSARQRVVGTRIAVTPRVNYAHPAQFYDPVRDAVIDTDPYLYRDY